MKHFSLLIISIFFIGFLYVSIKAIEITNKTKIRTSDGIYTSYISTSKDIRNKSYALIENCHTKLCKVQTLLDFVSNIPYHTNTFQQNSPKRTIEKNFGDCNDKSNLLISMLQAVDIKGYFVLVPKHIFVIVHIEDERLNNTKGIWLHNKKYYILESTAKNSRVGYSLKYNIDKIDVIMDPFSNKVINISTLEYKI